eukprot:GHVP01023520.1.p1 GENE.GHVP01023520.1~~GHVP01023520.1.p1  ORF type:complete len:1118 (-),score=168.66 GHVP01023520.1:6001-9354(-)
MIFLFTLPCLFSVYRLHIDDHPCSQKTSNSTVEHLACNGWVPDWDATNDFVASGSLVYLRRQLVSWSDSVKLRFGRKKEDNPWLWGWMKQYCETMAKIFRGVRLDNCHSTPLHVARYMIDACREKNENLLVYAELFTGNEEVDHIFEENIGLNALLREAMQVKNHYELGTSIKNYSGKTRHYGALEKIPSAWRSFPNPSDATAESLVRRRPILQKSKCPVILYDCTHDNKTCLEQRTAVDSLPLAATLAASCCAVGSTRGFDDLVPYALSVVSETRRYSLGVSNKNSQKFANSQLKENVPGDLSDRSRTEEVKESSPRSQERPVFEKGMKGARWFLNSLHKQLDLENFREIEIQTLQNQCSLIQRHNTKTGQNVYFFTRSGFHNETSEVSVQFHIRGSVCQSYLVAELVMEPHYLRTFRQDPNHINGLDGYVLEHGHLDAFFNTIEYNPEYDITKMGANRIPTGSVAVFRTNPAKGSSLEEAEQELVAAFDECFSKAKNNEKLLQILSVLLFSCGNEEWDARRCGLYKIPHYGELPYAGFAGVIPVLETIRLSEESSHPLDNHLRQGPWLAEYLTRRVEEFPQLNLLSTAMKKYISFHMDQKVDPGLALRNFDIFVSTLYSKCMIYALSSFGPYCRPNHTQDPLVLGLALASLQFYRYVPSAPLQEETTKPSIAAGLPHFSTGWTRSWGRDTFIALKGILLVNKRFAEAREEILGFARTIENGLIPNLLDSGRNCRYNARDATWFFAQSIQDYCIMSPEGLDFLNAKLDLKIGSKTTIENILHNILESHVLGINFREKNAGPAIDQQMTEEGFNVKTTYEAGLIYGGNSKNCGTWMDKMGSSLHAGNKGVPATPRDGCAIEIAGLVKSTVRWLSQIEKHLQSNTIRVSAQGDEMTFNRWNSILEGRLRKVFWIPKESTNDINYFVDDRLINHRGMWKDTYKASDLSSDYKLRPNFCVATCVAPEAFPYEETLIGIQTAQQCLLDGDSQLGIKTLSKSYPEYNGTYNNSDDSQNYATAHGFNYHQGPEWVWPLGYFLMTKFRNMRAKNGYVHKQPLFCTMKHLFPHRRHLQNDLWMSLPELTNENGAFCPDSCRAQAWSVGTILELFHTIYETQHPNS